MGAHAQVLPYGDHSDRRNYSARSDRLRRRRGHSEHKLAYAYVLTPKGIRTHLNLNKPIYERTAAYGHFGRTPDADGGFSWEKLDLVEALKAAL